MKKRDVMELVCVIADLNELINTLVFMHDNDVPKIYAKASERDDFKLLDSCIDVIVEELALKDPIYAVEEGVVAIDGKIEYPRLTVNFWQIDDICSPDARTSFELKIDHAVVPCDGKYNVLGKRLANKSGFYEDLDVGEHITERIVAYGTLSEYYIRKGKYEESLYFQRRYIDALDVATGKWTGVIKPRGVR